MKNKNKKKWKNEMKWNELNWILVKKEKVFNVNVND